MRTIKVTVFTPTYNRAYRIENLYQSLKQQTSQDFEWVVIDDGSIDETQYLFKNWINANNPFEITYIKTKNGGKHRAINKGCKVAKGELFFIVDSDDVLTPNAIERIIYWESTIDGKSSYCGVTGNRGFSLDTIIGGTFEGEFLDGTFLQKQNFNIYGDRAEVFYTELLKQYPFPEIEGENFMTENVVWLFLAFDGYKTRWFNEIIYITEYLPDGLSYHYYQLLEKNERGADLADKLFQIFQA